MAASTAIAIAVAGTEAYIASENRPKAPKVGAPKPVVAGKDGAAPDYTALEAQRRQRMAGGGRDSTILTGPLGVPGTGAAGAQPPKTLLGA